MKTLTIGNVELANRYILAPMAGVTDLPFRLLCREMGAGLLCMEMVSAKVSFIMVIKIQKACSRFIRMSAGVFAASLVLIRTL
mgnify:CR=1 FL=1